MRHSYTVEQLIEAVKSSTSIAQVLTKLKIRPAGGNYATIKRRIDSHGIDISHFDGQAWARGANLGPKKPLTDYLVDGSVSANSSSLRKRLIAEEVFEHKCSSCNLSEWLGQPISLELEHINGRHTDNRIENLTLLCPNCHAFTPTYRGRNIGK